MQVISEVKKKEYDLFSLFRWQKLMGILFTQSFTMRKNVEYAFEKKIFDGFEVYFFSVKISVEVSHFFHGFLI